MRPLIYCAIALCCLQSGCQEPPNSGTMPPPAKPFAGLEQIIDSDGPIRMLLVHGMSEHDPTWGSQYLQPYATDLHATLGSGDGPYPLTPVRFPKNPYLKNHKNLTDTYSANLQRFPINRGGRTILEAYVLTWSPLTEPFKQERFTSDNALPRLTINGDAKQFINGTLSDVVLYLAGYDHHVLEDSVCAAVEIFDNHGLGDDGIQDPKAPIVLLSESQGSIMLFDALLGELPYDRSSHESRFDGSRAHKELFQNTRMFIMNANQLPLLDAWPNVKYGSPMAAETVEPDSGPPPLHSTYIKALGELRHHEAPFSGAKQRPLDLIVLTDLNDDLSYFLDEEDVPPQISIVTLQPVNGPHYYVPIKLPHYVENPYLAHTGYKSNPAVADAIVNEHTTGMIPGNNQ